MHPALVDIRRQWQASQRLRIGVLAIGAILLVWLFLVLQDWRASLAQEYAARTEHLYKMQALAGQDEWIERARSTAEARAALEAELPDAATPGLAQANVQGWVRDLVKAYGEQGVQVQAQDAMPVDGQPGVWRVPVAISGPYRPEKYLDLVAGFEKRGTLSTIEQARVLNRTNKTFSLTVASFFRITPEAAGAQAGGADAGD